MPRLLARKPHVAEDGVQPSRLHFQVADDASHNPLEARRRRPRTAAESSAGASASNFAVWISTYYPATEPETLSSGPVHSCGVFLNSAEVRFIRQIREDLRGADNSIRRSPAIDLCQKLAQGVLLELANEPGLRVAAFADEDQTATLVAHSRSMQRQVSFEFDADGCSISIVSIDEQMRREELRCELGDLETIRKQIGWLNTRT